jgi:hypothetical protein
MSIGVELKWSALMDENSSEEKILEVLRCRLEQHLESRQVRSALNKLRKIAAAHSRIDEWELLLSAILLIETRERPRIVRVAEWIISMLFLRRATTCGYFQMRRSPFRFTESVWEAVERLEHGGCHATLDEEALEQTARFWHGAASKQLGESVGYAQALAVARACLDAKCVKQVRNVSI